MYFKILEYYSFKNVFLQCNFKMLVILNIRVLLFKRERNISNLFQAFLYQKRLFCFSIFLINFVILGQENLKINYYKMPNNSPWSQKNKKQNSKRLVLLNILIIVIMNLKRIVLENSLFSLVNLSFVKQTQEKKLKACYSQTTYHQ